MTLGGYCLAKGQILAVSAYSMHHNPAYWVVRAVSSADMQHAHAWPAASEGSPQACQDPEAYLPERFIDGTPEAAARPEHGWVPFGGGVRGCPGGKFSMEEATIALIRMYQRFRFELEPGQVRPLCHALLPRSRQPAQYLVTCCTQVPMALHETITLSPAHGVRLNVFQA